MKHHLSCLKGDTIKAIILVCLAVGVVGILAWIMMFEAGIHPTLAGVLVGLDRKSVV